MKDFEEEKIIFDREIECGNGISILTDSGRPGRSLILDRAVELGKSAKSKTRFASPYLPDGKL